MLPLRNLGPHLSRIEKRSALMSRIRCRGNKTTELQLASILRRSRIFGWRRHFRLPGTPDFVFPKQQLAIFVDGCFWHKCPRCYREPKSHTAFWRKKLLENQRRDRRVNRLLRAAGWAVLRIWECQLKKRPENCIQRLTESLRPKSTPQHQSRKPSPALPLAR